MNIFLRNISPDDIASVNYEEVPGSTQLDGEAEVVLTTDGDTAMVIPLGPKSNVKSTSPLRGLEGFDPTAEYGPLI